MRSAAINAMLAAFTSVKTIIPYKTDPPNRTHHYGIPKRTRLMLPEYFRMDAPLKH